MKKLLITGAASFLGLALLEEVLKADYEVFATDTSKNEKSCLLEHDKRIRYSDVDMSDYSILGQIFGSVDIVVYLSWAGVRGDARNNPILQANNFTCGINAVKSLVDSGCKKIILAGSQAEYGDCGSEIVDEKKVCHPISEYGKNKLKLYEESKKMCDDLGINLIEPRFFSMYGPGDYSGSLISTCIRKMIIDEDCDLTKCNQLWNFLYIDDAAKAVLSLCSNDGVTGIYNVADVNTQPLYSYLSEIKSVTGSNSALNFGKINQDGIINLNPSVDKIISETGWIPRTTFRDGILRIVESFGK